MGLLLLVLAFVMLTFGAAGAFLLDHTLHHRYEWPATLPGIELTIVPVTAVVAARWRVGADQLSALHERGVGHYLPLLMAATLVGLITYLIWSWATSVASFGPVPEFGVMRWLGTALAAVLICAWLPLFPRITTTLAGMVAGPALFALIGYCFGTDMRISEGSDGPGAGALLVSGLATLIWILGASWLSQGGRPLYHAAWSGAVMLCLTVVGIST